MNETVSRILSGLAIGGLVICALLFDFGYWALPVLLVLVFSQLGLVEFRRLTDRGVEGRAFGFSAHLFSIAIVLIFYGRFLAAKVAQGTVLPAPLRALADFAASNPGSSWLAILLLMIFIFASQVIFRPLDGAIHSIGVTILGVIYTTITIAHVFLYLPMERGVFYIVFFALIPISTDTGAYFAGRAFGKHNAGLKVSPRKTYEGYVGGFVFSIAVSNGILWGWQHYGSGAGSIPMGYLEATVLAVVFAVVSVIGDLAESALKRDARIKDSASTIPGHGGMLDLADALYLCLPLGYFYLTYKHSFGFGI